MRVRLLFYVFWGAAETLGKFRTPRVFGREVQVGKGGAAEPSSLQVGGRIQSWQSALEPTHQTPPVHRQS